MWAELLGAASGKAPSGGYRVSGCTPFLFPAWKWVTKSGGQEPSWIHGNESCTLMMADRERERDPGYGGAIISALDCLPPNLQLCKKNQTSIWFSYRELSFLYVKPNLFPVDKPALLFSLSLHLTIISVAPIVSSLHSRVLSIPHDTVNIYVDCAIPWWGFMCLLIWDNKKYKTSSTK